LNRSGFAEGRKASPKISFDQRKGGGGENLDSHGRLFPDQTSLFFKRGLVKENILLWNTHLMNLVLDDLMNQKNFLRKSFRTEGFLPSQVNISRDYQKRAKEEREEITYPSPRSSSPVWSFEHSTH
jgi:hypothetical protein